MNIQPIHAAVISILLIKLLCSYIHTSNCIYSCRTTHTGLSFAQEYHGIANKIPQWTHSHNFITCITVYKQNPWMIRITVPYLTINWSDVCFDVSN